MGLLDCFFHPNKGSVVVHSSQGNFFSPNSGSTGQRSSQGLFCFYVSWLNKCHIWSTSLISGPDFVIFHEFCILQSEFPPPANGRRPKSDLSTAINEPPPHGTSH